MVNNKIKSIFCIPDVSKNPLYSKLTGVNQIPTNCVIREEYIRCCKEKINNVNHFHMVHIIMPVGV